MRATEKLNASKSLDEWPVVSLGLEHTVAYISLASPVCVSVGVGVGIGVGVVCVCVWVWVCV